MRDARRLVVPVIALAGAVTALQVLHAVTSFSALDDLQRAHAADAGPDPLATTYGRTGLALFVVLMATWAVTGRWLLASRAAARTARPDARLGSAATVWLGWWLPVVSLWLPRRLLVALAAAHRVPPRRDHPDDLGRWWASWVTWMLAGAAAVVASLVAETPGALVSVPVLEGIATWGLLAAAGPWCRMAHDLAEAQRPAPERIDA